MPFYDDDLADMVSLDDFGVTVTSASPAASFNAVFEYVYGEEFGLAAKEIPSLTVTTSSVSALSAGDTVTVPAAAFNPSASDKDFTIIIKKDGNTGMTLILLESA